MRAIERVIVLALMVGYVRTASAGPPDPTRFPTLAKAWEGLRAARVDLQRAEEAYGKQGMLGGHGGRATEAVGAAQAEIELSVAFAEQNRRAGRPGAVTPKAAPTALPADARYPTLGAARLEIERAIRFTKDAGEYHAPIGALGGHALKAVAATQRAIGEINEAEVWLDAHGGSPTVAAKPDPRANNAVSARSGAGSAAPASLETHDTAKPDPPWAKGLPTTDQIRASIAPGKDEHDTDKRVHAAFRIWCDFIEVLGDSSPFEFEQARRAFSPLAYTRWTEYRSIWTGYRGGPSTDLSEYEHSRDFQKATLSKILSEEAQKPYWAVRDKSPVLGTTPSFVRSEEKRSAAIAAAKAEEQRRADEDARLAQEKKAQEDAQRSEKAKTDGIFVAGAEEDLKKARRGSTRVFEVELGRPLDLDTCPRNVAADELKSPCFRAASGNGFFDAGDRIVFPAGKLPGWTVAPWAEVMIRGDRIIALSFQGAMETDELYADLVKKYGHPTKTTSRSFVNGYGITNKAENWEWTNLPGLHVSYELNEGQTPKLGFQGTLTIELESVHRAETREKETKEAKRLKL